MYSVQDYLMLSIPNANQIKQADYVGEAKARRFDADDVENEEWRAVEFMTWDKPQPPTFPETRPPPATTELKIIHREFLNTKSKTEKLPGAGGEFDETKELSKIVADFLASQGLKIFSSDEFGEDVSKRRTKLVSASHEVVRLNVLKDSTKLIYPGGETNIERTDVDYIWGETTPFVRVNETKKERVKILTNDPKNPAITEAPTTKKTRIVRRREARIDTFITPPLP